jgi:flagellar L-ring protein precursor FlgH
MMMMPTSNNAPIKPLHLGMTCPARPKNNLPLPPVEKRHTTAATVEALLRTIYQRLLRRFSKPVSSSYSTMRLISLSVGVLTVVNLIGFSQLAHAESLFRPLAIGLAAPALSTPRMLYSPPKPAQVGDIVTILVREKTRRQTVSQVQVKKTASNGTDAPQAINSAVSDVLDTVGLGGLSKLTRIPTIPTVTTDNNMQSQANLNQSSEYTDMISCQVVQVLPNGNLMVQGRKANLMAKERTDTYVTGIINPYFLDSQNQIESSKVANLQVMASGQGVMSRGQGDGLLSKIIQFFQ